MNENKCCGNCKHFVDKKVGGYGLCESPNMMCGAHRNNKACSLFDVKSNNGWTEITPDNVDEFNADLIVVTDGTYYKMANDWYASLSTLAKVRGYYYYVLPELKMEETK